MAESKKTSAEQQRLAAEVLDDASKQSTAKKPASKTGNSGSSKAPAKKPTSKKPATKAAPKKEPPAENEEQPDRQAPVADEPVQQAVEQPNAEVVEEPAKEPLQEEQPVAQEPPAEIEQQPEQPVERPAEQPLAEQQPPEQQPAPQKEKGKKSGAFMDKTSRFINNKGKLPLWIVANSLLLLSSIFLIIGAFSLSYLMANGKANSFSCSVFQYFGSNNAALIKGLWQGTAGEWANGGYVMVGILMFFAFLVPLALIVKNVLLIILKKNKNVHMFDAIVTFTFLLAYLGVVGMYGANLTWAHILALIMAIVLLAYSIFVVLLETRGSAFPFFSIANLVMILLCVFLLTNTIVYNGGGYYAAKAAAHSGGGGFAFIMLLIALAALALLIVMQLKKLPGKIAWLFEFLVPAVAGVLSFIALISFAGGNDTPYGMGPGFVVGAVFTMLLAVADVVFALVPKLHKFNVKLTDRMQAKQPQIAPAPTVQPVAAQEDGAQPHEQAEAPAPVAQPEAPAKEPKQEAPAADGIKCPACGTENEADSLYCIRCGRKLK